jgi:hypothetical protein
MGFKVRCVFSGACVYVPNMPLDPKKPPTKMAVIMADARKARKGIDGTDLTPHFPLLIVDSRFVPDSSLPPGTQVVWPLDRLALRLKVEGGHPRNLVVSLGATGFSSDDFRWAPGMNEAAPNFTEIDPKCFEDLGSKGLVVTRFILDRGFLASHDFHPKQLPTFSFESNLGSTANPRKMANRSALNMESVKKFSILWRHLDSKARKEREFSLASPKGELVELNIGNFCDGCLPKRASEPSVKGYNDIDFRWHYELCRDRDTIPQYLQGKLLPIPKTKGSGGPGAIQCMSGGFASHNF